jgi:3-deoxy-D-manno-octulosonic-acid transferase
MTAKAREPLGLKLYRAASRIAEPIARIALNRRLQAGKEDAARINERRGVASRARPEGPLIWIHGASVGESLSVIPLVKHLRDLRADWRFMVTTGTVTSAQLLAERLPDNAFHQYIPLDHPDFVHSFMDHWRPDAAIFVESEFWPNLILAARKTAAFMALVNGRISPRSYDDWRRQPNSIKFLLSSFDLILAQDRQNAERLETLSGRKVEMLGNLKNAAPPLPASDDELHRLKTQIGGRPFWLAASTHPGEEETVFAAHKILRHECDQLLTIIAPRHPARGGELARLAGEESLRAVRRSNGHAISGETDIYLADTLGELGLLYRLSDVAFVGGSINPKGGHNPLEPARLDTAILHGPEIFNFNEIYAQMRKAGGAALVRNERELASAVRRLFADAKTRAAMAKAARKVAERNAVQILDEICGALTARFPARLLNP